MFNEQNLTGSTARWNIEQLRNFSVRLVMCWTCVSVEHLTRINRQQRVSNVRGEYFLSAPSANLFSSDAKIECVLVVRFRAFSYYINGSKKDGRIFFVIYFASRFIERMLHFTRNRFHSHVPHHVLDLCTCGLVHC